MKKSLNSASRESAEKPAAGIELPTGKDITRLLLRWRDGDQAAADALMPLVYRELLALARHLLRRPATAGELQPTELVSEVWLRLNRAELGAEHRRHFMALSARVMRQILVDQARRRGADKRGGDWLRVTMPKLNVHQEGVEAADLLALDEGLSQLADAHPRAARATELHYFGGLTGRELAEQLTVTERTVERDLRFGRAWLRDHLRAQPDG